MENLPKLYKKALKSKNPEKLNDVLIELGKDPKMEYLSVVDDLINNCKPPIINKVKINLVYLVSQISTIGALDKKYLNYLIEKYYDSDIWIRSEIVTALDKFLKTNKITDENLTKLVANALREDYEPIKLSALNILRYFDEIPDVIFRSIILALNERDENFEEGVSKFLKKFLKTETQLFDALNTSETYKILKKNAFRRLLIIFYDSINDLQSFQKRIKESDWENQYKDLFLREMETFNTIISKR